MRLLGQCRPMANKVAEKIAGEWILVLSLIGLVGTSLYLKRFPAYDRTDMEVVYILMVFLVIVRGMERSNLLHVVAAAFRKGRGLSVRLILLTSILSMFVTNDVAVLTVVPMTLALDVDGAEMLVILETLAANAASVLSPIGNPQNIFIYFHYRIHAWAFIRSIFPFFLVSLSLIFLIAWRQKIVVPVTRDAGKARLDGKACGYLVLFCCFILAVLKIVPLWTGMLAVIYAALFDRKSLAIDWLLLLTFMAFFGFTDNLTKIVRLTIDNPLEAFIYPALGSQVLSNVPSTLFFADLTNNWKALLWGVSIGGMGNLVGSLASLIAYRLYKAKSRRQKRFLIRFHVYGYGMYLMGIVTYLLIHLSL